MSTKAQILSYFPPVNTQYEFNLYDETHQAYKNTYFKNPFNDNINTVNNMYFYINTLQQLRKILNSNISNENFILEIDKILNNWRLLLDLNLVNLIQRYILDYNEFIKYAMEISFDNNIDELSDDLQSIKLNSEDMSKLIDRLSKLKSFGKNKKIIRKNKNR